MLSGIVPGFYNFESAQIPGLVAIGAFFMASEKLVFHIEARTEAVSYSPSDVALSLGLVLLDPVGLLIARAIGASIGQALFRGTDRLKWVFNLANFTLETVLAYLLFRTMKDFLPSNLLAGWVSLVGALFLAILFSGFLVAAAISCFEGELFVRLKTEVTNSPIFHLPGATVAAALGIAADVSPQLGLVVASVVPVVWLTVRSHGKLLDRHSDLVDAHEFSREVGDALEVDLLLSTAASQIAANMRGNLVAIRIWDSTGIRTEGFYGGRSLASELPSNLAELEERTFAPTQTDATDRAADGYVSLRAVLSDEQGTLGCVTVADRLGVNSSFEIDDLRRLTTMTQQLTVAVRKGQLLAQIRHEATHDAVTALTNRGFFEAWLDEAVATTEQKGCVLFIDLDRFKEVNDAFGHHAGDALLKEVATRIQLASPIDGLASRFGGDEFAVFAPNTTIDDARNLAARIVTAVKEPIEIEGTSVSVAPSIGIVESPTHGRVATKLLRRADIAMYEAKNGPCKFAVYNNELEENDSARLKLLSDLRAAIVGDELEVHFQPQVDMRTGKVTGAEALARWTHPDHGNVSPAVFVALAEDAGLIDALTDCVLAQALRAAAQWHRRGWDINVAVNISARSFLDQNIVNMVKSNLHDADLDPSLLTLEITESTMMSDPARTHEMLHILTALGVTISVDDFGTGYSSLHSLGHFPVSELKIDRSFVMAMTTSDHDAIIVRSTIELAHNLGLKAVAEGVETDDLRAWLQHLDCDLAQGYGISRPLPLQCFNHWLIARQEHEDTPKHVSAQLPDLRTTAVA